MSARSEPTVTADFLRQLHGFSLTTANILYGYPDYPTLFQTYIWQDYDIAPLFPALRKFLRFWKDNLDGPLIEIKVASAQLIRPLDFRAVGAEMYLN